LENAKAQPYDLVNEGGTMDLWGREACLFKYGSVTVFTMT
jgi:hypothetical protein